MKGESRVGIGNKEEGATREQSYRHGMTIQGKHKNFKFIYYSIVLELILSHLIKN